MANSRAEVCCQPAPLDHNASIKSKDSQMRQKKKKGKSSFYRSSASASSSSSSSSSSLETLPILDHNNNCAPAAAVSKLSAVRFKYRENASREELEGLRKLLIATRDSQLNQLAADELEFYRADFERMLADDWLVTRFLLRGRKAHERANQTKSLQEIQQQEQGVGGREEKRAINEKTLELIKICAKFRYDYRINNATRESEFPLEWVQVNGLFDYKSDRLGNPTVYLRVALHRPKLIESPEARHQFKRYMLYTLELCDQKLHSEPGKAICCIFDMTNVAFENIDLELTSWMIKSFKSSSPKLLCYVIIYNPPWFFTATFKLICNTLLSDSKRQSIKFAHGKEILEYIEYQNLPNYLQAAIDA